MAALDYSTVSFPEGIPLYSNILIHRLAERELRSFFEGDEARKAILLSAFHQRLQFLHDNLGQEFMHKQWFEAPKKLKPYRFIRFNRIKLLGNLRIIYYVAGHCAYLLVAFNEKNASDYAKALQVAKNRISSSC